MPINIFEITIDLPNTEELLNGLNLQESGRAQRFFSDTVMRHADKYVPFNTGVLKNSAQVVASGDAITYTTPYARYLWFGKLYVDPITGKGAFHDPKTGRFWSRPGVQKIPTDKDLQFNGAPERGARWVERMWTVEGEQICGEVERFIMMNKKI